MDRKDTQKGPVRISRIAGRYLLFDHTDVSILRREHDICGVLMGTSPQNPTQNAFLWLPIELRPDDVAVLVATGVGIIYDEALAHSALLHNPVGYVRKGYVGLLKFRRQAVEKALAEEIKQNQVAKPSKCRAGSDTLAPLSTAEHLAPLYTPEPPSARNSGDVTNGKISCTIVPTTTPTIMPCDNSAAMVGQTLGDGPLYQHLHSRGYYMTPGLRFGCQYSVYPGDPLRFHAHFLANGYGWDEEIPVMNLVGNGRLGTSVKKGFLFGGRVPESRQAASPVRAFCVEWAYM